MGLNTTPRTFVTGELETAAIFNAELRDALTGIQSAWTSFTPTWSVSSGTAPAIGNGTLSAAYQQIGKTILFRISLTAGSTTTFGSGGQFRFSLPVNPLSTTRLTFATDYFDSSVPSAFSGTTTWDSVNSVVALNATPTTAGNANRGVTASVPMTWATGDIITINGAYESA